ncbi:hypothetical protein D3C85_1132360 [compost metagenome]
MRTVTLPLTRGSTMKVVPVICETLSMNSLSSVSTKLTSYNGVSLSSSATGSSAQARLRPRLSTLARQSLAIIIHPWRLKPVTAGRGGQGRRSRRPWLSKIRPWSSMLSSTMPGARRWPRRKLRVTWP